MRSSDRILRAVRAGLIKSTDIARELKISRQAVAQQLSKLVAQGKISKQGSTRGATYSFIKNEKEKKAAQTALKKTSIKLVKKIKGLEEDLVFNEISLRLNLKSLVSEKSLQILQYAFTEMLNNAIDHSGASAVNLEMGVEQQNIYFVVVDKGRGIFDHVQKKFALESEFEALEHVLKGKQTTDPKRHSGQGIFFTSRIADLFEIRSHKIHLRIDNKLPDTFLSETRNLSGTFVRFVISRQSRKSLKELFDSYSDAEFSFDKSQARLKLSRFEGLLSRSQAKRLLIGLDDFRRLEFDFQGVKEIGQAFADEVFRIYARNHPGTLMTYTHANEAVAFMIERARKV